MTTSKLEDVPPTSSSSAVCDQISELCLSTPSLGPQRANNPFPTRYTQICEQPENARPYAVFLCPVRLWVVEKRLETECEGETGGGGSAGNVDIDGDLLARFSCLGTTDRDVLVNQLHSLLGAQLSREGCEFFLEIGSWNLQAAVGAYYDFYGPVTVPKMAAKDVTLFPGDRVPPNAPLSKAWRVTNTGTDVWQSGISLTLQSRNTLCGPSRVLLPALSPGQEAEVGVSVSLLSPSQPGLYQSSWCLTTPTGGLCAGQCVHVLVKVGGEQEEDMATLTQQLAAFSTSDQSSLRHVYPEESAGSSPPPPSPVSSPPLASELVSHSISQPSSQCEMDEQPSSQSSTHHFHPQP